ncbi:hypothetical protein WN51_00979 [Melipona quadrifasciata]|uniref:Uncharacterized protein n=1 Tax=Melipona quadrifasciata TaxID=166423 RepID=A0A0N0BEM9_9HYME|nr:hypothetical protein WN51_00979 [Melipona quadrifasciata]
MPGKGPSAKKGNRLDDEGNENRRVMQRHRVSSRTESDKDARAFATPAAFEDGRALASERPTKVELNMDAEHLVDRDTEGCEAGIFADFRFVVEIQLCLPRKDYRSENRELPVIVLNEREAQHLEKNP